MTTKEAFLFKCKKGYWLYNISELGKGTNWKEVPMPHVEPDNLFGYPIDVFLAKQYKQKDRK